MIVEYELQPIHIWVILDVVPYISARHPLRHHREWGGGIGNSKERDDVGMRQPFPHGNLLVKDLKKRIDKRMVFIMNHRNVRRYPLDFVHVDTQGLYRHTSSAVSAFPNTTETRSGDELSAAT